MATRGGVEGTLGEDAWPADGVDLFVAEARIDEAARARGRERWLRRQAAEEATLEGTCRDLAERGEVVVVTTTAGIRHRGQVDALGRDHLGLRARQGLVLVPFAGLASIEVHDRGEPAERPLRRGLSLAEVLADLAAERPMVRLRCNGADALTGELRQCGRDVAAVRVGAGGGRTVYVRLSSLTELSVLSG